MCRTIYSKLSRKKCFLKKKNNGICDLDEPNLSTRFWKKKYDRLMIYLFICDISYKLSLAYVCCPSWLQIELRCIVTYLMVGLWTSLAKGYSMGNVIALMMSGMQMAGRISSPTCNSIVTTSSYRPQVVANTHTDTLNSSCPYEISSSLSIHIEQRFIDAISVPSP